MPHHVLVFYSRREGTSPSEFESGFEAYMPTIAKETQSTFPISHTRHYVKRGEDGAAVIRNGTQDEFKFDTVAVIEFENEEDVERFAHARHGAEVLKRTDEENRKIMPDRETMRAVVLSGVHVTRKTDIV